MKKHFRIGTRGSLLALTQATLILEELELKTGHSFELVKIQTQGDQIVDKPLWQLDGKDFFTKELDTALLKGEVDLVIHSYKDLGSDRPQGIELAAVTQRSFPQDILLFNPKSRNKKEIIIGTSSPRRIYNTENYLLPFIDNKASSMKCEMLRGNVNTRIQKLKDGLYDGIILAYAGLERLAQSPSSAVILKNLVQGMYFSILPLSRFPTAAAQGALGVEYCPENCPELKEVLECIHSSQTFEETQIERHSFAHYGGGCHLAVGISAKKVHDTFLEFHCGSHNESKILKQKQLPAYKLPKGKWFLGFPSQKAPFSHSGITYDNALSKRILQTEHSEKDIFITSSYCIDSIKETPRSLWASGSRTWKKLVEAGYWVNASADALGISQLESLWNSSLFKLLMPQDFKVAIATEEKSQYENYPTIAAYKREVSQETPSLEGIEHFYWTSFPQYQHYVSQNPEIQNKSHYCGMGRTYEQFLKHKIPVRPLYGMTALKELWSNS